MQVNRTQTITVPCYTPSEAEVFPVNFAQNEQYESSHLRWRTARLFLAILPRILTW